MAKKGSSSKNNPRQNSEPDLPDQVDQPSEADISPAPDDGPLPRLVPAVPIVGIGASAGGQEAFKRFLTHVPPNTGLAFALVQHLDPTHKSLLVGLVQRFSPIRVRQIEDGMPVEPDCVYIVPPNQYLAVLHGLFHLMEPESGRGPRLPIDYFFRSLAQDQADKAIGIILSGTGSDGALGLKAIKGEGGLALVQEPASAGYDGMPRSAIATGLVDYVLLPEQMPPQLLGYINHTYIRPGPEQAPLPPALVNWLPKIFILLRNQTGHDFSLYRPKTIVRRIERRMALQQVEQVELYYQFLQQNPAELGILFKDLLIGVTSFFRDPAAFSLLQQKVIPHLFKDKSPAEPIRVWMPGCATGEEAYSMAILLQEQLHKLRRPFKCQLFATDIDSAAIEIARAGRYPSGIASDVSPERLQRFFVQGQNTYQVEEHIRGMLVFAVHSLIKDPPFSKMDLISCRNLLIYLEPALQKKIIAMFHYALNPGGFLFLGSSENPGEFSHLFSPVERKWKLFQRNDVETGFKVMFDLPGRPWAAAPAGDQAAYKTGPPVSLREVVEKMLLAAAPPCAVVNKEGDILFVHGRTGKYLELPAGEASPANLFSMAQAGLKMALITAVRRVAAEKQAIVYDNLPLKSHDQAQTVRLTISPIAEPATMQELILVLFEDIEAAPPESAPDQAAGQPSTADARDQRILELENELQAAKQYLQATIEELEAANEELKSTNEELQSTNEELETSREELQSINEELVTLNSEHEQRIVELIQVNNDLNNLLARLDVGVIFLDSLLCIRRFNAVAARVSNLIETDIGRPFSHIVSNLAYDDLLQDLQAVLDTLAPREVEVHSRDGRWFWLRSRPYQTAENAVEGVVLTFTEITERREMTETIQAAREFAENILATIREPLLVLDAGLRVVSANHAFYHFFQVSQAETAGQRIYDLGNRQWRNPGLQELLEKIVPDNTFFEAYKIDHDFPGIGRKVLLLNARQIRQAENKPPLILLVMEEVSETSPRE